LRWHKEFSVNSISISCASHTCVRNKQFPISPISFHRIIYFLFAISTATSISFLYHFHLNRSSFYGSQSSVYGQEPSNTLVVIRLRETFAATMYPPLTHISICAVEIENKQINVAVHRIPGRVFPARYAYITTMMTMAISNGQWLLMSSVQWLHGNARTFRK